MRQRFNIYCDESAHLEHDRIPIMVLGAVWCPVRFSGLIAAQVRQIKAQHNRLSPADAAGRRDRQFEVKWTKVSRGGIALYADLIEYFFWQPDLHFRGVVIDKTILDHARLYQSHDDWYYKMMFTLLGPIIDPQHAYRIYLDIKDTRSEQKRAKLEEVLRNKNYDFDQAIIERVQQIRSYESELLQLADLLIGAVSYCHRRMVGDLPRATHPLNTAKLELIERIRQRSGKSLQRSTLLREEKFNLLCWKPREDLA
jgi:hypothetical protein